MAQFSVNSQRSIPTEIQVRVKWDGRYVAGVSKVSTLKRTTEVVKHREGGDPSSSRKSPGRTEYDAITLERGVTHDTEFEKWANKIWNYGSGLGAETSLADFRKDITVELYNEAANSPSQTKFIAAGLRFQRCRTSMPPRTPFLLRALNAQTRLGALLHVTERPSGPPAAGLIRFGAS